MQIRGATIQFSSKTRKEIKNKTQRLETTVLHIEAQYSNYPNEANLNRLKQLKQDLDNEVKVLLLEAELDGKKRGKNQPSTFEI